MWSKSYRDYPKDEPLIQEKVESGKGIIGCEMHDLNGWGRSFHVKRPRKKGMVYRFLCRIFGKASDSASSVSNQEKK